jgi:ABC-type sugar transport system ATPase subunit
LSVGAFALRQVRLEVAPGEYFVLLGPTGSGKTLLLECLCGLYRLDSGRVIIAGRDVTNAEPRHRQIGYLPQDYALFPHCTVRQNVAFGLRRSGASRQQLEDQAQRLMEELGIAHLADRRPVKLSGGEKQRVALARALAVRPQVLLLDEPVSALDESTRDDICLLLRRLNRQLNTTVLHVCHNFVEMMSVADRAAVIVDGRIIQVGTPGEILQRPANLAVAQFVQAGNLLPSAKWLTVAGRRNVAVAQPATGAENAKPHAAAPAQAVEGYASAGPSRQQQSPLSIAADPQAHDTPGAQQTWVMIRSENIRVLTTAPETLPQDVTLLPATLLEITDLGATVRLRTAVQAGVELIALLGKREYNSDNYLPGQRVFLAIAYDDVHVITQDAQSL